MQRQGGLCGRDNLCNNINLKTSLKRVSCTARHFKALWALPIMFWPFFKELLSSVDMRTQDVDWNVDAKRNRGRFEDAAITQMMIVPSRLGESRDGSGEIYVSESEKYT